MATRATQVPKRKVYVMGVGMLIVPGTLVAGYLVLRACSKSEASGSIQLRAEPPAQLTPSRCESGLWGDDAPKAEVRFHGVDLFDTDQPELHLRIREDASRGAEVTIRRGGAAPVIVKREACAKFASYYDGS